MRHPLGHGNAGVGYERTQSRIGVPLGSRRSSSSRTRRSSGGKVQTPYLTIHNDEDEGVQQGIEFFSALRRLGAA